MALQRDEVDYDCAVKVRKAVIPAMQKDLPDRATLIMLRETFRKGRTHADHFYKRKEEE